MSLSHHLSQRSSGSWHLAAAGRTRKPARRVVAVLDQWHLQETQDVALTSATTEKNLHGKPPDLNFRSIPYLFLAQKMTSKWYLPQKPVFVSKRHLRGPRKQKRSSSESWIIEALFSATKSSEKNLRYRFKDCRFLRYPIISIRNSSSQTVVDQSAAPEAPCLTPSGIVFQRHGLPTDRAAGVQDISRRGATGHL